MAARILLLLFSIVLTGCTMWKQKAPNWSNATGGQQMVRLIWKEVKAGNTVELQKHLAATWVFLTPEGPLDRAATLERFNKLKLDDYSLGEFTVQPNGADLVVSYTATLRGSYNGEPLPAAPRRMMTVWQQAPKASHGWVAIAHVELAGN